MQLVKVTAKAPNIQRHVVILFDEMKIKEDLVFDKNSGSVVGVVKTTDVNDKLLALESSLKLKKKESEKGCPVEVATHMLAVMVRGLVTGIRFPYAHAFSYNRNNSRVTAQHNMGSSPPARNNRILRDSNYLRRSCF